MGCDIHSIGQVFKNKKWLTVARDIAGDDRSYTTFGILADVRNGVGFAGMKTGTRVTPIALPRGYPDDFVGTVSQDDYCPIAPNTPSGRDYEWVSDNATRAKYQAEQAQETSQWLGDHSHSWLTLEEISAYITKANAKQSVKYGYISEAAYKRLRGTGKQPETWCGGISGPNIVTMAVIEYEDTPVARLPVGKEIYIHYAWIVNTINDTNLRAIEASLAKLAKTYEVTPAQVRMIFGFDS